MKFEILYSHYSMGKFKEGSERGLRMPSGPDDSCDGPQSCLECVVWFVGIIVLCVIIALLKA